MGKKSKNASPGVDPEDANSFKTNAEKLKKQGDAYFAQSQLMDALNAYERALSFTPSKSEDRALLHSNRAACYIREKRLQEAKRECDLALEAQDNYGRALVRRARVFEMANRPELALSDLEAANKAGQLTEEGTKALTRLKKLQGDGPRGMGAVAGLGKGLNRRNGVPQQVVRPQAPAGMGNSAPPLPRRQPTNTLTVKASVEGETHTVVVPVTASYTDILAAVSAAFPTAGPLALKYRDSEDDLVTIMSRTDVRGAVQSAVQKMLEGNKAGPHGPILPPPPGTLPVLQLECAKVLRSPEAPLDENPKPEPAEEVVEIDEWLLDFAEHFKQRLELKEEESVDIRAIGLDRSCEVLEAVVGAAEAGPLMDAASAKFQEAAAAAMYNWGNVHVCAARKLMDVSAHELMRESINKAAAAEPDTTVPVMEESAALEQAALRNFDALETEYNKATEKYAESLRLKDDFYEAAIAWGQQAFERAKLLAARANAAPKKCKPAEADAAFATACEKFAEAVKMIKASDAAAAAAAAAKGQKPAEADKEAEAGSLNMEQQVTVLWGNVLFERSTVKFKRGDAAWRADTDAAVEKFRAATCPEGDIEKALANHVSGTWKEGAAKEAAAPAAAAPGKKGKK